MSRRLLALGLAAAAVLGACSSAPAAPALTDPKEILVEAVSSLADVQSFAIDGQFTGSINAEGLGEFDLSTITFDMAVEVEGKKARLQVDAPSLMGTKLDLILVDSVGYMKVDGIMGGLLGIEPGKYLKMEAGESDSLDTATDPEKAAAEFRAALDKLPTPPTKLDDEACGDATCYHVQIALDAEDLAELADGSTDMEDVQAVTFELWSDTATRRPTRFSVVLDGGAQGTFGADFSITYDGAVDASAPPDDQVVEGSFPPIDIPS